MLFNAYKTHDKTSIKTDLIIISSLYRLQQQRKENDPKAKIQPQQVLYACMHQHTVSCNAQPVITALQLVGFKLALSYNSRIEEYASLNP